MELNAQASSFINQQFRQQSTFFFKTNIDFHVLYENNNKWIATAQLKSMFTFYDRDYHPSSQSSMSWILASIFRWKPYNELETFVRIWSLDDENLVRSIIWLLAIQKFSNQN